MACVLNGRSIVTASMMAAMGKTRNGVLFFFKALPPSRLKNIGRRQQPFYQKEREVLGF
jgi:hypothetical protein